MMPGRRTACGLCSGRFGKRKAKERDTQKVAKSTQFGCKNKRNSSRQTASPFLLQEKGDAFLRGSDKYVEMKENPELAAIFSDNGMP